MLSRSLPLSVRLPLSLSLSLNVLSHSLLSHSLSLSPSIHHSTDAAVSLFHLAYACVEM